MSVTYLHAHVVGLALCLHDGGWTRRWNTFCDHAPTTDICVDRVRLSTGPLIQTFGQPLGTRSDKGASQEVVVGIESIAKQHDTTRHNETRQSWPRQRRKTE